MKSSVKKAQLAGWARRPTYPQEDEIYVRVGATHERLSNQADNIDFQMPLHEALSQNLGQTRIARAIAPMDIPGTDASC